MEESTTTTIAALVAHHAPTRSTLTVLAWSEPELMSRQKCQARATEMGLLSLEDPHTLEDQTTVGRRLRLAHLRIVLEAGASPVAALRGHALLIGGYIRKCLLVHYATDVATEKDEPMLTSRLAVARLRSWGAYAWSRSTNRRGLGARGSRRGSLSREPAPGSPRSRRYRHVRLMDAPLDTDVAIEAPEHIVFSHRIAGPGRRAVAYVIDLVVCYGAVLLFAILILFASGGAAAVTGALGGLEGVGIGLILLAVFAAQWLDFVAWEGISGRTPGKSALRLRVLTTSGRPIHFTDAALRNILRAADALPNAYVVGLASMALTRRFQRLGDLVAGTMVIVEAKASAAVALQLWPPASPEELAGLPDDVALDADERAAIELLLREGARWADLASGSSRR